MLPTNCWGLHKAVPTLYHCYTWLSAEPCLAEKQFIKPPLLPFKKNIADMADLLKQMYISIVSRNHKLWHKGPTSR